MRFPKQRKAFNIIPYALLAVFIIAASIFVVIEITKGEYNLLGYYIMFVIVVLIAIVVDSRNGLFSGIIEIDEKGITYTDKRRVYSYLWDEIMIIGFTKPGKYMGIKDDNRALVISKKDINISYINMLGRVTKEILVFQNRKGVTEEIKKYWKDEILNENKKQKQQS